MFTMWSKILLGMLKEKHHCPAENSSGKPGWTGTGENSHAFARESQLAGTGCKEKRYSAEWRADRCYYDTFVLS